jgi:hypothetical protein
MSIAEMFGKYEVTNEVNPNQESVNIELSYEGHALARIRLEQNIENPFLIAHYNRNSENSVEEFKQLYQDVRNTFVAIGVDLEKEVSIHEDERVAKQSTAGYTMGTQLVGILFGDNITNTIELTEAKLELYDKISKKYPNANRDETLFGFLGEVTQGSYLLEVEDSVYIAMDNPEVIIMSSPFIIQINSNRLDNEDRVNEIREELIEFLEQEYGKDKFYFCNGEREELSHKFRINLAQIVGRKKLGGEINIAGLLEGGK